MQKKIIAVICVLMMLTVLLASCGNKYLMAKINGVEYPLVTDAEGNTEVNGEGKIAVYVTDAKGNLQYDSDGNPQKNYYNYPMVITDGLTINTHAYTFTMPSGWELQDNGIYYKKGTDQKCSVQIVQSATLKEGETFDEVLDRNIVTNQGYIEKVKATYPDASMNVTNITFSTNYNGKYIEYLIKDPDGKVVHYAALMYFCIGEDIYSANYMCDGGAGYDVDFNFSKILETNLVIK